MYIVLTPADPDFSLIYVLLDLWLDDTERENKIEVLKVSKKRLILRGTERRLLRFFRKIRND